jgi:hypothetical protein
MATPVWTMMGLIRLCSTWVPISRLMTSTGVITVAPSTTWAVNSPRKSGASRKLRETERSTPAASPMA